jgi:type II secretion system protein H
MVLRAAQERILTLEIGYNKTSGFTLIELLVTLVVIGLMSSLVFLNFSTLNSVESKAKSFERTFEFLTEESITTGNLIGWYADENIDSAYFISMDGLRINDSSIDMPQSGYKDFINFEKVFRSFDGNVYEINDDEVLKLPLLVFYPSGENSGGSLDIKQQDYIQRININKNGKTEVSKISY